MADNCQEEYDSTKSSYENYFCVFTSDNDESDESKKDDENADHKEVIIIEENVTSSPFQPKSATLEELANSDFIRNRQLAAKSIVEYLHQAGSDKEALHSVISVMCKLSEDEDIMVRSELMEQIPPIALFCKDNSKDFGVVIRQQIVPYTVKLLTDIQKQVRKIGHTTLLVLLENNVIDNSQLSEWICPLVAQLVVSENSPEDLRLEDVSVMCKMIPYVGKEITEKFFLEPFLSLCRDSAPSAREVCMFNFGSMCQVIGTETAETTLLSAFLDLCQESWYVRMKCIDVAIDLATVVSPTTRNEILSHIYVSFLKEECAAVSHAAYQSLGRFISTFAEPSKTGLNYSDGIWIDTPCEDEYTEDIFQCPQSFQGSCFEFLASKIISKPNFLDECSFKNLNASFDHVYQELPLILSSEIDYSNLNFEGDEICKSCKTTSFETFCDTVFISNFRNLVETNNRNSEFSIVQNCLNCKNKPTTRSLLNDSFTEKGAYLDIRNENIFNNFQFWRTPLPDIELDIEECKSMHTSFRTELQNEDNSHSCVCKTKIPPKSSSKELDNMLLRDTDDSKLNEEESDLLEFKLRKHLQHKKKKSMVETFIEKKYVEDNQSSLFSRNKQSYSTIRERRMSTKVYRRTITDTEKIVYDQDIVPPELLMEFINEITMSSNEDVKENHVYYFPSVAYALGRKHWPCIRDLFHTISSFLQFRIRKTVASSLHELAVILGPDITTEDLLPVFLKLLRDLDVRYTSSLLKNLSHFLKNVKPHARRQFLPLIEEICLWNKEDRNWRYRLTVSEQFIPCIELFYTHEALHFLPASLLIMQDSVAVVRRSGVELLAVIIKSIITNPKSFKFVKAVLCALDERYRRSSKWLWRQFYVYICQEFAVKRSLPTETYVDEIVPNLFSLAWDTVPNIRLAVARCLGLTLLPLDFLPSIKKSHYKLLLQVMYSLQSDVDRDVRHFAFLSATASGIWKLDVLSTEKESCGSQFEKIEEWWEKLNKSD